MKTSYDLQLEKAEQDIADARNRAAQAIKYSATRKHYPRLPAHELLHILRNTPDDKRLTQYAPCSPYNPRFTPEGYKALHCRWIENTEKAGLRFVNYADQLDKGLRHKGWFSDHRQEEVFRGAVWQLPARKGCAQYVYGYEDPNNDGAALIEFDLIEGTRGYHQGGWCDVDDMLLSAARDADYFAERMAEAEKDSQLEDMAEQRADELRKEADRMRRDLCRDIRERREAIQDLRDKAADILANPYQLVGF